MDFIHAGLSPPRSDRGRPGGDSSQRQSGHGLHIRVQLLACELCEQIFRRVEQLFRSRFEFGKTARMK